MGDHRVNPQALVRKSMPPAPVGKVPQAQVVPLKVPKAHIVILAPDQIRKGADGRATEIYGYAQDVVGGELVTAAEPAWIPPPDNGQRYIAAGDQLTDEDFDIVHVVQSVLVDTRISNPDGSFPASVLSLVELHRMDYRAWAAAHEAQRRGEHAERPGAIINGTKS